MSYEGFKCILSLFYGGRVCSTQHSAEIRSDDLHIIATRIERSNYSERGRDIRVVLTGDRRQRECWSALQTPVYRVSRLCGGGGAGPRSKCQPLAPPLCPCTHCTRALDSWPHWRQPVLGGDTADLLSAPAVIIVITALSFSLVSHSSDTNWLQSYEKMIQDPGH